jgi:hypothetical protein
VLAGLTRKSHQNEPSHCLPPPEIPAFVEGNDTKPWKEWAGWVVTGKTVPGGDKTFLQHIIGIIGLANVSPNKVVNRIFISLDEEFERASFASFSACRKVRVTVVAAGFHGFAALSA